MAIFSFFKKSKSDPNEIANTDTKENIKAENSETGLKQWSDDRYEAIVVQRNLAFLFCVLCVAAVAISTFFIGALTLTKTIQPMLIEIERSTGITNIVNPNEDRQWTESKAVNEYFLVSYLRARESYNVATYLNQFNDVVRLMSSPTVYQQFRRIINNVSTSPIVKYGANNYTTIKIRSIQFLPDTQNGKNVQIRFAVVEQEGAKLTYNKIVSIVFNYLEMNLSFNDRMVNPLGFQVSSYAISDDTSI